MGPVVCKSCGSKFLRTEFSKDECRALGDQHSHEGLADELKMLFRVQAFYKRHPNAEGRIKPDILRMFDSRDPAIAKQLGDDVPFDQIVLPTDTLPAEISNDADQEVVEYLRRNSFLLGPRLAFVSEAVARFRSSVGKVKCPQCDVGCLHVPPENWSAFTADTNVTWYWPDRHGFEDDGTLVMKSSGWSGNAHWNGRFKVEPKEPDYALWCWVVSQKEYHRLVEKDELPAIRERWAQLGKT